MGRLAVSFAVAAGLAAGQNATAQNTAPVSPAAAAASTRPNFRAKPAGAAPTGTDPAATGVAEDASAATSSRFITPRDATTPAPVTPGEGAPFWQDAEPLNVPMDYFRYFGLNAATTLQQASSPDFNNEIRSSQTDPHRPLPGQPVTFNFQQSAPIAMETQFAGCPFTDRPDDKIFWFNPYKNNDGSHTDLGTDPVNHPYYRYGVPGEWTISQPNYGVRGLSITGAAEGNAPGAPDGGYAVAVSYVTNRRCSDANDEYGFWQELASPDPKAQEKDQSHVFYYSTKTNCYSAYGCRASASWGADPDHPDGPPLNPQDQVTSPLTTITNVREGLPSRLPLGAATEESEIETGVRRPILPVTQPGQMFNYSAYIVPDTDTVKDPDHATGFKFRVQVTDADRPSQFAKCSINGGPEQDCTVDVPIANWFDVNGMQTEAVQVVTGTQTSGVNAPAPLTPGAKFTVKSLTLGK